MKQKKTRLRRLLLLLIAAVCTSTAMFALGTQFFAAQMGWSLDGVTVNDDDVAALFDETNQHEGNYTDLQEAFDNAAAGYTVVLLKDVDATASDYNTAWCLAIQESFTLDGNGKKLTVDRRGINVAPQSSNPSGARRRLAKAVASTFPFNVAIKNITIENKAKAEKTWGGVCLETRGKLGTLTLEGVTLTTNGSSFTKALTPLLVSGTQESAAKIVIKDCTLDAGKAASTTYVASAIKTINPVDMEISGSTINGQYALNLEEADESKGSAGSAVTITGSTLTAITVVANINDADIEVKFEGADNVVNISGEDFATGKDGVAVSGGKFSKVIADKYLATGYVCHKVAGTDGYYLVEEGTYVAKIGEVGYPTLSEAIACAEANDEIVLQSDVTLDGTDASRNAFPAGMGIKKNLTINGQNHTVTPVSGKRAFYVEGEGIDVVLKDLNIVGNGGATGPLWVFNAKSLTLDHVSIDGTNYGGSYNQPLTINSKNELELNIKNGSVIKTNDEGTAHYAVIAWTKINATIKNSELKGWAAVYTKAANAGGNMTAGANGSTINIDGCTITSKNIYNGTYNAFAAINIESEEVKVSVTNTKMNIVSASDQKQALTSFSSKSSNSVILGEGNTVTMTGDNAVYAFNVGASTLEVQAGTTSNVEIPEQFCAEGFIPVKLADGTYGVKEGEFIVNGNDGKGYETLQDAAAAGNTTLTLRATHAKENVFAATGLTVDSDLTIDLNGLTLELSDKLALNAGTLTFKNGQVKSSVEANGGTLAFDETCGTNDITVAGDKTLALASGQFTSDISGDFAGHAYKYLAAHYGVIAKTVNKETVYVVQATEQISTVEQLQALATLCNDGNTSGQTVGKIYEMTADIDLSSVENWTPMGGLDSYPGTVFKGTFDGMGYSIKNLTCEDTHANHATAALFGAVSGATIKNLTLENVDIHSTHYAAGFVGFEDNETVPFTLKNCHVKGGKIVSTPELVGNVYDNGDKVGGLIAYCVWTVVEDCSVEGVTLQGYRDIGGLAGYINKVSAGSSTVTGNTVKDVTLVQDNTNGYKTNADGSLADLSNTVGEVVGGRSASDVKEQANNTELNTATDVTIAAPVYAVTVGTKGYATLEQALKGAVADGEKNIVVELLADAELTIKPWSGSANSLSIGDENTETITINGNSHTLTFMTTDTDWNNVATYSDNTVLKLNDMTIDQGGKNTNGTWNAYDINFNCAVELTDVVANRAVAFKNDATLTNVTVNDEKDVYGIWIQTTGQNVVMNNVTVNVPNGRAIAVKDEYVEATPEKTTSLKVENSTFVSANKGAILVTAKYGAEIEANGLDISKVTADTENAVWVSADRANLYGEVTLTGDAKMIPEGGEAAYTVVRTTDDKVNGYYNDLAKAVADAEDGQTITLKADINLAAESMTIAQGVTIDGNGHHVILSEGTVVYTYAQTDVFSTADEAVSSIEETVTETGYAYSANAVYYAKIGENNYRTLQAAVDAAYDDLTGDQTITLLKDIEGYTVVRQKTDLNLTIDGQDKAVTVKNQIVIDGDGRASGTETLTIKGVKFEGNKTNFLTGDAFIIIPNLKDLPEPFGRSSYNYAHNVTVDNCSFTSNSENYDVVGVKATSGAGNYNLTIKDVEAANLHSLAQLTGTTGAAFDNCKVAGGESFVNVDGGGGEFTIKNNEFASADGADGYGLRLKGGSAAVITLEDNSFKANTAVVLGKNDAPSGSINIVSGTYVGAIAKNTTTASTGKIAISGGRFSADIADEFAANLYYVEKGLFATETPETPNGVKHYVARVTHCEGYNSDYEDTWTSVNCKSAEDVQAAVSVTVVDDVKGDWWYADRVWVYGELALNLTLADGQEIIISELGDDAKFTGTVSAADGYLLVSTDVKSDFDDTYERVHKSAIHYTVRRDPDFAKIRITKADGTEYGYDYFGSVFAPKIADGDVIKLQADVEYADGTLNVPYRAAANITLDLNGYTFSNSKGSAIGTSANKSLTIIDSSEGQTGKIVSSAANSPVVDATTAGSKLTINGGSFEAPANSTKGVLTASSTTQVEITGGNFTGEVSVVSGSSATIAVSGGNFDHDPRKFIVRGKAVVENEGAYVIVDAVCEIGETGYATFAEAVPVVKDGETIKMLADTELAADVECALTDGQSFTLTFDGKTIAANGFVVKLANGTSVSTDAETDIFAAIDPTYMVKVSGTYTYSVVTKESEGVYEFVDGTDAAYALNADAQATKVTYTRSFDEERVGKYQAWFVPFDYTITEADLEQFTFYKINMIANSAEAGVVEESDKVWIYLNEMKAGDVLKANKPYVYRPTSAVDNYEFTSENVTLKARTDAVLISTSTTTNTYSFYGTYAKTSLAPSDEHTDFYMSIDGDLSYVVDSNIEVGPYRWYLRATGNNADYARSIGFIEDGDSETNGVQRTTGIANGEDTWFTLDGHRVEVPAKGVYIRRSANGQTRKVSVK